MCLKMSIFLRKHSQVIYITISSLIAMSLLVTIMGQPIETLIHEKFWYKNTSYQYSYTTGITTNQDSFILKTNTFATINGRIINADVLMVTQDSTYNLSPLLLSEKFDGLSPPINQTAYISKNLMTLHEIKLGDLINVRGIDFVVANVIPPGPGYYEDSQRSGNIVLSFNEMIVDENRTYLIFFQDGFITGVESLFTKQVRINRVDNLLYLYTLIIFSIYSVFVVLTEWIMDRRRMTIQANRLKRGGYDKKMLNRWFYKQMFIKYVVPSVIVFSAYITLNFNQYIAILLASLIGIQLVTITPYLLFHSIKMWRRHKYDCVVYRKL